jgi:nucleotide-binding universal stress UspA family protein
MYMRGDFSSILMPHDGSEMSDKALDEATKFAKLFSSKIILLHVVDEKFTPPSILLSFIKERASLKEAKAKLLAVLKIGVKNMLRDRKEKIQMGSGIDVNIEIAVGSPFKEIVKVAKSENVGIIIMGSRRFKGIGKIRALGSVAMRVTRTAACPVMLVH